MSLQVIGPYEILGALGAGGMGQVFRARDTRLNREVAIKVLPKDFATDPDRLRRFEQESRTLAALNHPNILTIHDAGVQESTPYLVSELLEGETLREELKGGALSLRKLTDYALQAAQGLAAAHGKGIIHRDLKPENIFITKDGRVKILDFGLAKLQGDFKSQFSNLKSADPEAPTLAELTQRGMVLGTPAYMSPEQVRGEPTDHRTDIFAFGCLLYEMLTGHRAFQRKSAVETMSAVLKEEPPALTQTQTPVPPALERLVHRCLEKQPDRRFQTASDLAFAVENAGGFSTASLTGTQTGPGGSGARWMRVLPWGTAGLLALLALSFALAVHRRNGAASIPGNGVPVTKVQLYLPGSGSVMARSTVQVVISPDGRKLAYVNADGLWLYRLDRIAPASRLVSGRDLWSPFWSPNSDEIGYFDEQKLHRTSIDGARPTPICSHVRFRSPHGEGAAWLPGNRIVFATGGGPLLETPASGGGGEPSVLLPLGPDDKDFEEPCALPDGRGVLFIAWSKQKRGIDVWTPDGRRKELVSIRAGFQQPVYSSSGYVIFWRTDEGNEGIWAFSLSLDRLERTDDPFLVSELGRVPSASLTGALAFALHQSEFFGIRQLTWLDRSGQILGTVGEPIKGLSMPRLSPDGRQVVGVSREAPGHSSIWLVDTVTGGTLPFLQGSKHYFLNTAQWAADGRQIIFMKQDRPDEWVIAAKSSDGTGQEQVVSRGPVGSVSPSGHYLFVGDPPDTPTNAHAPGYIELSDPARKVIPFPDAFKDIRGRLSPDDRFLAFNLAEGEKSDVYVVDFPSFRNRRLVSRGGGWYPEWKPDSQELFFLGENRHAMMSARLKPGTTEFEPPEKLFDLPAPIYNNLAASVYDVAPDGRFLMLKKVEDASTEFGLGKANAQVVLNWFEEFRVKNR